MSLAPYDEHLVQAISASLTLRKPNVDAVDALARALDTAEHGATLIAALATGVGKTYVAGAMLDYLYESGVRDILIVTPGTTIFRKTLDNLTPGHPKYLRGLSSRPLVLTVDNYRTAGVAHSLENRDILRVFVMTVQSLLAPTVKANRKAHVPDENVGIAMVEHLRTAADLVVIADEHHIYYSGKAEKFEAAISSLDPDVVIGLTATPHPDTDPATIVFDYPLAEAIADGYVKIPVLVARPDGLQDNRSQMADGVALLNAKRAAVEAFCTKRRTPMIEPVMLAVASNIEEATVLRDILLEPGMIGDPDAVLLVTSEEPDTTLQLLDTVDEPGSRIRAIVSVSMLKEGWDCRSIYVIASTRAMESDLLTEQILGRGLRLPFGARTTRSMLDSVEVLSHAKFSKLLADAQVLLTQTLGERARQASAAAAEAGTPAELAAATGRWTSAAQVEQLPFSLEDEEVTFTLPGAAVADATTGVDEQMGLFRPDTAAASVHHVGGIATLEARLAAAARTEAVLETPYPARSLPGAPLPRYIPVVTHEVIRPPFSLAQLNRVDVEAIGARYAEDQAPSLRRTALDVVREGLALRLKVEDIDEDRVTAYQPTLPMDTLKEEIVARLMRSDVVCADRRESEAARTLVDAFLTGAGADQDEPWTRQHAELATTALVSWIKTRYAARPATITTEVGQVRFPDPAEITPTSQPKPRHVVDDSPAFTRLQPYQGWKRGLFDVAAFDAYSSEFALAVTLDDDRDVAMWARLDITSPLRIAYVDGGAHTYYPDFLVVDTAGTHWVVEGKRDSEMGSPRVLAKQKAAQEWVGIVNAAGTIQNHWGYLLLSESVIESAKSWRALKAAGQAFA